MSHGCINLPLTVAAYLSGWAPLGTPVNVYKGPMSPDAAPSSFVQLWCLRSGNVMSDFETEQETWDWLVQAALEFGLEELEELGLLQFVDGHPTLVAMDDELVRRVEREIGQTPREH